MYSICVQRGGKVLIGGLFTTLGGQQRNSIGRLNADGTLDTAFNPGANGEVSSLAVQADGKILVGGSFTGLGGDARNRIGRLNPDGSLDSAFNPGANGPIYSMVVQTDGKIIVAGSFTTLGGQARNRIGRLNAEGSLDITFNPGASSTVYSLAVQTDGKVLACGEFAMLGGSTRNRIGRLNNTEPATENLTIDGSNVTWLRGGAGPEVWRTILDASTNGADWIHLGSGERIAGGWQHTGVALPTNATIRARGFAAGGQYGASSWPVEAAIGPLSIFDQPNSRTNDAGSVAVIRVVAAGTPPLSYQWRKGETHLADGGRIFGTRSSMLALTNVLGADAGDYSVIVGNAFGSVTSSVATLTVLDPVITRQPISRSIIAGTAATFNLVATGTPPLSYRWRKDGEMLTDGANISGAQTPTLTLSQAFGADAGGYSVVVGNGLGSVTSSIANLVVADPAIVLQPVSKAAKAGETVVLMVGAVGTAPLVYQWRQNGMDLTGQNGAWLELANVQGRESGNYQVVVSNPFGSVTSLVAELTVNLATPDSFNTPGTGFNGFVYSMAVPADGRILVGGSHLDLAGNRISPLWWFNADGSPGSSFTPGADGEVQSLVMQADGSILVGGEFTTLGGQPRHRIGRLNANGALDITFNPGANDWVGSLAVQTDGKILVGGGFTNLAGKTCNYIGRLNPDGTLDASFVSEANDSVYSLAVQPDGKILVGGGFFSLDGQTRLSFARLNTNGTPDTTFNPQADSPPFSIVLDAEGRILVGGGFVTLGGKSRYRIGRLYLDGTVDTGFNPEANGGVTALALQSDGKIVVGGSFTTLGGQTRNGIGRLNADGSLDTTFNPGTSGSFSGAVYALAVQADGRILVGGLFTYLGGENRNYIGRLNNSGPATQNLAFDGSTITWHRGGTGPEVSRTTFDSSTNGIDWRGLGAGERISGGWRFSGVVLPTNSMIRARGFVSSGGTASGFVETIGGPFAWANRPVLGISGNGSLPLLSVAGDVGSLYALEFVPALASTNAWQLLTLLSLTNTSQLYLDQSASGATQRFYRARLNQ